MHKVLLNLKWRSICTSTVNYLCKSTTQFFKRQTF